MGKSVYQKKCFRNKLELINSIDEPQCACGCGEKIQVNEYNYIKIINEEPVYIVGHNARDYTYFLEKEFIENVIPRRRIARGPRKKIVSESQYHNRMFEKSSKVCVICGMTNDEHKQIYNCRLHMHCRDGEYSNQNKNNWECVCQEHHSLLDKLDYRRINQWRTGKKGYINYSTQK